ncbi:MAG: site-specific DNA-methyltransferase [Planctomycetes bacterium]|nr:site-specific DNA-methyltransferase [Planctomycetota bacterium]
MACMTTLSPSDLLEDVRRFDAFGSSSVERETLGVPTLINEFWTRKQRQGHPLHELSYRACFKPQLPAFFIERLTEPGQVVFDPFGGRGTTALEAALRGRIPWSNDLNPLSQRLLAPRLDPPSEAEVAARLEEIDLGQAFELAPQLDPSLELEVFFHPETLRELVALRAYLLAREARGHLDRVDAWIRMVALNRLTGHSSGFFSVYTLPPNQAVTAKAQKAINARREQAPEPRPIVPRILRKTRSLQRGLGDEERARLSEVSRQWRHTTAPASATESLPTGGVDLVVTSPPFLDVVNYANDNWLRCWFCGLDSEQVAFTQARGLEAWGDAMEAVLREQARLLRPGGHVAFEVGEVRGGRILLEETVVPRARAAGLEPVLILINDQEFTKTANCWGVSNRVKGTNTNRVCVLRRP